MTLDDIEIVEYPYPDDWHGLGAVSTAGGAMPKRRI